MKKISCNIYLDILPLYVDDVVSADTRKFVEEHLVQCESCSREARLLGRKIELPPEKDVNPLEAIRKQWTRNNILVWGMSAVLLALCLVMALPVFDTSMQYHFREIVVGGVADLWLLLPLAAVGFGLEWWFVHLKKLRWLALVPLVFPAAVLVWAELAWAAGGWDRFGSSILWVIGFPTLLGGVLAVALKVTLDQGKMIRRAAMVLAVVLLAVCVLLWPRPLRNYVEIDPEKQLLEVYTDGTTQWRDHGGVYFAADMGNMDVVPCLAGPDWDGEDYILVRLNGDYVLLAPDDGTPYVYCFSGDLAEFDGSGVRYQVYYYPALYDNLRSDSRIAE